ncbi:MAG: glycosyltransferase [Chlorobium sp.]|uniref:glycosyltransferase n=1 Tax=Chlorobium sp. TaxID=1095 RepID=UPI0025C4B859|nr:glycosyltransferase [Chlorobium sp.]MCF8383434.1 glycosyltransferase [Chlorobium sp.]
MRLLIVASGDFFSDYGGGQVYVRQLVDELIEQGVDLQIATPGDSSVSQLFYKGCSVHTVCSEEFAEKNEVTDLLKDIKPDIVHAHGMKEVFAKACATEGLPFIVTAHHGGILCPAGALLNHADDICSVTANDSDCLRCVLHNNIRWGMGVWPLLRLLPLRIRLALGAALRRMPFLYYVTPVGTSALSIREKLDGWNDIVHSASLLVAPSAAMAQSMFRNGAPEDKIKIVPHGITVVKVVQSQAVVARQDSDAPLRFFFLGRISYVKGVHVLLRAFSGVTGKTELHIIGGAGNKPEERYMRRLMRKYASDKRIIWKGKVTKESADTLISQLDVLVHPTICLEVFGLNIAEALSMGKPVIATRCGGAEQQIQEGSNGFLVEPDNPVALTCSMQLFVDRRVDAISMALRGKSSVRSMKEHVAELMGIYKKVIASNDR